MKRYLELRTGGKMPIVGLGTGKLGLGCNSNEYKKVIECALEVGYRHFDTAARYGNEHLLGQSLKNWIGNDRSKREELFITSKLPVNGMHKDLVPQFVNSSLKRLQMDYIDLYLIHWPVGVKFIGEEEFTPKNNAGELLIDNDTDIIGIWEGMENLVDCGKARAIGLSNFNQQQIERILKSCRIPPSNLQIEAHVYFQQKSLREFCHRNDIQICAYAPLGSPFRRKYPNALELNIPDLLNDKVVMEIAAQHGKTSAQIVLRFLLQGLFVSVIPKSCNPTRLKENFDILDFELTQNDVERLRELDRGENGRTWHAFDGARNHPECPF